MARIPYWNVPYAFRVGQPVATADGYGLVRHIGKVYIRVEMLDGHHVRRFHPSTLRAM